MKPLLHAKASARKFGGHYTDYMDIHEWFDMTKAAHPDIRHRAILHHSMGIYICATVFGDVRTNSDGRDYAVRDVAEQHVLEDMGTIPTLSDYLNNLPLLPWLGGKKRPKGIDALGQPYVDKD